MSDQQPHGSDSKQGPGWWIASDDRWYPPELHPDYGKPSAGSTAPTSGASTSTGSTATGASASGGLGSTDTTASGADSSASGPSSSGAGSSDTANSGSGIGSSAIAAGTGAAAGAASVGAAFKSDADAAAETVSGAAGAASAGASSAAATGARSFAPSSTGSSSSSAGAPPTYSAPDTSVNTPSLGSSATQTRTSSRSVFEPSVPASTPGGTPSGPRTRGDAASFEFGAPAASTEPETNVPAGSVSIIAGLLSMLGSFMLWATDTGVPIEGFTLVRRVAAFDANGIFTLLLGIGLVVVGVLLVFGMRPLWLWSTLAVVFGTIVLAAVIWSYVDITGRASDDWAAYVAESTQTPESTVNALEIGLNPSLGLIIAGLGGLLGVLTAPLARRGE